MRKILIVDDDNYKRNNIISLLQNMSEDFEIIDEKALNPGLCRLFEEDFDVVLLDMSLPMFDLSESKNFESFGGLIFLEEMKRKKTHIPTIIITQYEIFGEGSSQRTSSDIDEMCEAKFQNYKGLIVYSSSNSDWKEMLVKMIGEI